MSKPINDGGPAFPMQHSALDPRASGFYTEPGMSLRDWLAGQASDEDIAEQLPSTVGEANELYRVDGVTRDRAWARYRCADAMLAARAGGAS